ncbi:MAG: hypothetical protein ACR2RF_25510 [Geminicoccaceae bacterium]
MTARPAVDPNTFLKRDGSNTITGIITPDADGTRNFGSSSLRFNRMFAESADFVGGTGSVTRAAQGAYSVVGGRSIGPGNNTLQIGGGTFPPIAMFGNIYTFYASGTARMRLLGGGSSMFGSAFTYSGANQVAEIICDAASFGSFTGGYAYTYYSTVGSRATIQNQAAGAFLWAYPQAGGTHVCRVFQSAAGSFMVARTRGYGDVYIYATTGQGQLVHAYGYANSGATSRARGLGKGVFVHGSVNNASGGGTADLEASGEGSSVLGSVTATSIIRTLGTAPGGLGGGRATGAGSLIEVQEPGGISFGRAAAGGIIRVIGNAGAATGEADASGSIIEADRAAFARGRARGGFDVQALGGGSGALGDTTAAGPSIIANAFNAFQMGPGTNAAALSLQVGQTAALGTGLHFHGAGAPAVPVNGDVWVDAAGFITMMSGGVVCVATNAVM